MKFGLCTLSRTESPVESVVRTAGDVGYDGVEIWGKDHVDSGDEGVCRSIRDAAQTHDLEIPVYGSYARAGSAEFGDEIADEVAIADRLDADLIRLWAGSQEYGDHDDAHWEAVVEDLETAAELAADRGLAVTVEKHANTLTNDTEGAERLIEAVSHPACLLNWQPVFGMPADEVVADAERLVGLSNNVHIQAVPDPESSPSDRCLLEDAYFDVEAILEVFAADGFDGFVNVEFVTDDVAYEEAIEADLEYLRSLAV
ncbi:sugar phosphate isomerase/epimerase family protein [Natrononativus amylolyticus]|uniref:sugar phosphate isomerase/epimerase family protein n=1 Tax=Natrononativus amylolyticus TaxID=2963434 RepID=UPI0020CBDCF9|nr:sugar phosphate isomerase/epimerase family protein [Natrononativus amylolyticus]